MNHKNLNNFKNWFSDYSKSFYSSNTEDQKNISLKVQHTFNVCKNIIQIADEQSLNQNELMLAETVALFHDLGRFPQYAEYKTFRDSISVNHGRLGADILEKERVLRSLPENEQELVVYAVRFHNAFAIPDLRNPETILFIKLIRDADKLDIWRVFSEYFESDKDERASAVDLGLPDIPEYSAEILSCLYKKQLASLVNVKTLYDFKLMQLSWIYDLNFKTSFRLLLERDYITRISATLPRTDKISKALSFLQDFAEQRQ